MSRAILLMAACIAMAACEKKPAAPPATAEASTADAPPATDKKTAADSAARGVEGDAASVWVEMIGMWAPEGACGDHTREWRLESEAFHLYETHCEIARLEMLANGVRAVAHCSVEGDDDRVEDAFKFVRRADATLSVINEANEAATDGLQLCD